MSVIARLEVIPQTEASMSDAIARAVEALDQFDVSYETTPTDTVVEADDPTEVFAAAEAAHRAVDGDRVVTSLEVDDLRTRSQRGHERVESVERRLGRPARRRRDAPASERGTRPQQTGQSEGRGQGGRPRTPDRTQSSGEPQRYGGPWRAERRAAGSRAESGRDLRSGQSRSR